MKRVVSLEQRIEVETTLPSCQPKRCVAVSHVGREPPAVRRRQRPDATRNNTFECARGLIQLHDVGRSNGSCRHPRARAAAIRDEQSFRHEAPHRLAYGRATHLEPHAEIAFGYACARRNTAADEKTSQVDVGIAGSNAFGGLGWNSGHVDP